MLKRRTNFDDNRGVGEELDDTDNISTTLRVFIDTIENSNTLRHNNSYLFNFPISFFTTNDLISNLFKIFDWNLFNFNLILDFSPLGFFFFKKKKLKKR
jgi:hypothetical protein